MSVQETKGLYETDSVCLNSILIGVKVLLINLDRHFSVLSRRPLFRLNPI